MKPSLACALLVFAAVAIPDTVFADSDQSPGKGKPMELFDAIEQKAVTVRFIPISSETATVIFANQTDRELVLRLPDSFGAVHVDARRNRVAGQNRQADKEGHDQVVGQFGGFAQNGQQAGFNQGAAQGQGVGQGQGAGQGGQNLGGGFGQGNGQQNGAFGPGGGGFGPGGAQGQQFQGFGIGLGGGRPGGGFGGLFRVRPNKTRRLKVETVCLEHGKPDPNPRMQYELVALETLNVDPLTAGICTSLGNGSIDQSTAQAATWNVANGVAWSELSEMNRVESRYTGNQRRFSPKQLGDAKALIASLATESESTYSLSTPFPDGSYSQLGLRPQAVRSTAR